MSTVTLDEARAELPSLIHSLTPGREVVITLNGLPVAKLVAHASSPPRPIPELGTQRGSVLSMDHFDDPLDEFAEYTG